MMNETNDTRNMTDYEYIMSKCRTCQYKGWDEEELNLCLSLLPNLTREELVQIYRSKRLYERHPLKVEAFKVLFADKIGQREERIRTMPTEQLIEEFKDKKSGNVALIRKEMRVRYKENANGDRYKIAAAFRNSIRTDLQWVKSQERKERYANSNKNNYKVKTTWKK